MAIRKVGIAGGGKMATDIFKMLSESDFDLVLWSAFPQEIETAEHELTRKLMRRAKKSGLRGEAARARLDRMAFSTDMNALADVDIVIEAIIESLEPKRKLFSELDALVRPNVIFATNTSSLSPSSMALAVSPERRARFIGLHYFFPVTLIGFVEVIPTFGTSQDVTEDVVAFVEGSGKRPLLVEREVNGFLVNRLLAAYYNEGADVVGEGFWLPGKVDEIGKRFATMGPCESVDYVGLDIILHGADCADVSWGRRDHVEKQARGHEPWPAVYYRMREDGRVGRKVDAGFFRYKDGTPVEDPDYFEEACPTLRIYHRAPGFDEEMVENRLRFALLLESVLSVVRGIGSKEDIDMTMKELLGLQEGPFAYIESVGVEQIRLVARDLEARVGSRFAPLGFLRQERDSIPAWERDAYDIRNHLGQQP